MKYVVRWRFVLGSVIGLSVCCEVRNSDTKTGEEPSCTCIRVKTTW